MWIPFATFGEIKGRVRGGTGSFVSDRLSEAARAELKARFPTAAV